MTTTGITTEESRANAARQRELVELLQNRGQLERTPEFFTDDYVDHSAPQGVPPGAEGVAAVLGAIRAAFPDHDARIVHMVAEGDFVATHKTFTGTHEGEFLGIPATGRRATIRVMDVVRYRDGRVAEHWNVVDIEGLRAQLRA